MSQFTLYALAKGNKPDYHLAMAPDKVPAACITTACNLAYCCMSRHIATIRMLSR